MAFAVASQLDHARLSDGELASASAAAQHIADDCLADGSVGRVGLEIEAHCYDPTEPHRRPTWDEITEVLESIPAMPGGSAVTVEPSGAEKVCGRTGAAAARPGPAAPGKAHQSSRALRGDATVLHRQPHRCRGRGHDDVDGV